MLVAQRKWVALLDAIPFNKPYYCHPSQISDLVTIRATAGRYNNDDNRSRRASVNIDFNNAVAKITIYKKDARRDNQEIRGVKGDSTSGSEECPNS